MTLHCGDAVEWALEYDGPLHHAMLCDPPYHLIGGGNKGFMGKDWDGGDVAFRPETWAAFMRVLHPGAFCMAFASAKGFHRQAVAIEDAGFILHPFICWSFGSGFPKATRIDTQLDRDAGAAHIWSGHRYGGQAMKPAVEPILVFQKPYEGRPVDCITATGAGALNIEAGKIGNHGSQTPSGMDRFNLRNADLGYRPNAYQKGKPRRRGRHGGGSSDIFPERGNEVEYEGGRWPANLILGDDEAAARLDVQSGVSKSSPIKNNIGKEHGFVSERQSVRDDIWRGPSDTGGASRFFFKVQTQIEDADPLIYRAKCGPAEREAGLEAAEAQLHSVWEGPASGVQSRNIHSTPVSLKKNIHPTVKPLSLTRYLASLLLPPKEYAPRRLFVPFAGVASEICGADLAGWEEVNGVELSEEYIAIGEARRKFWNCNVALYDELTAEPETPDPQSEMTFE